MAEVFFLLCCCLLICGNSAQMIIAAAFYISSCFINSVLFRDDFFIGLLLVLLRHQLFGSWRAAQYRSVCLDALEFAGLWGLHKFLCVNCVDYLYSRINCIYFFCISFFCSLAFLESSNPQKPW